MQKRHHRLAHTGIVCGILLVVGLIAMNFPVFLQTYDQWGFQIKTIPLVVISAVVLLAVTVSSALASVRESLVPHRDRG